jgi:hypothetical protein
MERQSGQGTIPYIRREEIVLSESWPVEKQGITGGFVSYFPSTLGEYLRTGI